MERTKTISLTTEIFNKLSSKTFITTTCPLHQTNLPIYLCINCISNPLCELCYNEHICQKDSNNLNEETSKDSVHTEAKDEKIKASKEIGKWISERQEEIVKSIGNIQKEIDISKQNIHPNKFIISPNQNIKTLSELHTHIITTLTTQMNSIKNELENLIKTTITSTNIRELDNFISQIKINLNKINTLEEIQEFTQKSKKYSENSIKNIQNEYQLLQIQSESLFKKSLQNTIKNIFMELWGEENNEQNISKEQPANIFNIETLKNKILNIEKENSLQNEREKSLLIQLSETQQILAETQLNLSSFKTQSNQSLSNLQLTITSLTETNKSLNSKIQEYETSISPSTAEQLKEQKTQNNLLEHKIKEYEQQLANQARTQAGGQQNLTDRFDVEEVLRRVGELEEKCEELTIEGHAKDRKIVDMISEVNRMQIKIKDGRSPQGSARKPSN